MVGRRIGRFEIISPLGKGGMGSVWKAQDSLLGRAVAIKVLSDELAQDDESRRRFRREGEVSARLDHPGICPVYEAGEQDGVAWLAMAWIDGETLSERIRRRLMPIEEVLRIGRMTAEALGHAHDHEVLHRDVTARNIMIARDGRIVLLDFGLAIVADATRITGPGAVVGTIAYMAPELLSGQNATMQSDLYGLGVVLYEALTGARPFYSENAEALRYRVLQETPEPVRALRPEVPKPLEAVVMKAMARMVEDRYESAVEMLAALKACEAGTPVNKALRDSPPPIVLRPRRASGAPPDSEADTAEMSGDARPAAASDLGRRLSEGAHPVFLAVLPVEDASPEQDPARARVLADLTETAAASLGDLRRVRVVQMPTGPAGADLRARARAAGANLVLQSRARAEGLTVRVTFSLIDPETATRLAGGTVDGSVIEPFRLEDRFVEAVSRSLGRRRSERGVRTRPTDPAARDRYALAVSYLERFDNEASLNEAIRLLEGLVASEGESARTLGSLARGYLAQHALTHMREFEGKAARACERAAALDAGSPEALLAMAELHLVWSRPEQALAECSRLISDAPECFEGYLARVKALDALGRLQEADTACRALLAMRSEDWRGHHLRATRAFRNGHYDEAIEAWTLTTRLCTDNAGAWRNLGAAFGQADRLDEAVAAFRRSIAIRPSAMAYWNLGTALFYLRRYEECSQAFEQAVALNPSDAVAWGNLGNACRFIPGQEARMREALERAIALGRQALATDPRDSDTWARLAGWLSNLKEHGPAIESVQRALELSPGDVSNMARAGFVYLGAGDRENALHWIDEAVRHGHGTETLRRAPETQDLLDDPDFHRILERGVASDGP